MKNKNYLLISCIVVVLTTLNSFSQHINPDIKNNYQKWNVVKGDNTNSISDSLAVEGALDGSTKCTLYLKNTSATCKHLKLSITFTNNNKKTLTNTIDVYVKANGVIGGYYKTGNGMDFYTFGVASITQYFVASVVEVSDLCR